MRPYDPPGERAASGLGNMGLYVYTSLSSGTDKRFAQPLSQPRNAARHGTTRHGAKAPDRTIGSQRPIQGHDIVGHT